MTLLGVLGGSAATIVAALIAYLGARRVQRAAADKSAVDGFDLLTGRLEARLSASEKREAELLARLKDAESTIATLRSEVEHLTRRLSAYIDEDQDQEAQRG